MQPIRSKGKQKPSQKVCLMSLDNTRRSLAMMRNLEIAILFAYLCNNLDVAVRVRSLVREREDI